MLRQLTHNYDSNTLRCSQKRENNHQKSANDTSRNFLHFDHDQRKIQTQYRRLPQIERSVSSGNLCRFVNAKLIISAMLK